MALASHLSATSDAFIQATDVFEASGRTGNWAVRPNLSRSCDNGHIEGHYSQGNAARLSRFVGRKLLPCNHNNLETEPAPKTDLVTHANRCAFGD